MSLQIENNNPIEVKNYMLSGNEGKARQNNNNTLNNINNNNLNKHIPIINLNKENSGVNESKINNRKDVTSLDTKLLMNGKVNKENQSLTSTNISKGNLSQILTHQKKEKVNRHQSILSQQTSVQKDSLESGIEILEITENIEEKRTRKRASITLED